MMSVDISKKEVPHMTKYPTQIQNNKSKKMIIPPYL